MEEKGGLGVASLHSDWEPRGTALGVSVRFPRDLSQKEGSGLESSSFLEKFLLKRYLSTVL